MKSTSVPTRRFSVTGMMCAACSARVEKAVRAVPGVAGCAASLLTNELSVEGDGRYVLDLTARPQASYLLTLTTDDGRQHTIQLLKQSDRFGTN